MSDLSVGVSRVVILGGGFGGRDAARRLAKRLPANSEITLVDRNSYTLFTPMLTEVAGRSVAPDHIKAEHATLPSHVNVIHKEIIDIHIGAKRVTLAGGMVLFADHLVFALGSVTNFRGIEGAQANSLTMKTLEDATHVRALAEQRVAEAAREQDVQRRRALLTFVVAGGGYTGVETVASLNDLVRDTAREYAIDRSEINVTLIEPSSRIMAEMPQTLANFTERRLKQQGVEVRKDLGVDKVEVGRLTLTDSTTLAFGLLVWDTGVVPNPLIATLGCVLGKHGGLVVSSTFEVPGMPGIWAIGDCAEIPKPYAAGKFFEPTAQNATREGAHVADNIVAACSGRKLTPFTYRQMGELAVVSRRGGVANVLGVQLKGVLGWLAWRAVYLLKMPGIANRIGILLDWIRLEFGRKHVPVQVEQPARVRTPLGAPVKKPEEVV